MTTTDWDAAAEPGRRVGQAVEFHPSIGSTNDRAWELLRAGREGIAVVADLQTAGRGRHGRAWASPGGVNLMVSIGARVDLAPEHAWRLGAAAALALLEASRSVVTPSSAATLALKWPNDLVDARGGKLAGLLAETAIIAGRVHDAVIGVGINVNWRRTEMPREIADRATSLCELQGLEVDRVALLGRYLDSLDQRLSAVERGRSPIDGFRAASWLTGRQVEVSAGERTCAGVVAGIGEDGSLLLETDGGQIGLGYGEVTRVGVATEQVPA